ncbi:16S rRNA (cytosine(967)-C(5))-methyltransferase RsmB [Thermodesulfobacteriota bacterium]
MKSEKTRDLALKMLNRLGLKHKHSGNYLDDLFQSKPNLDDRDRAFISHLIQGVLRWRLRLDWVIGEFADSPLKKIEIPILNILRLALFQIFFLDRVPDSAAVNEAVNQAKADKKARHLVKFVNGVLRNVCRHRDEITFPDRNEDRVKYLSVFHSYPQWLVNKWIRELGEESTEGLLSAQNSFPDLNIRANSLKVSRAGLIEYLANDGVTGKPTPYAPEGILLGRFKGRVDQLPAFKTGLFQVQDQAAQVTSHLLRPRPGEVVLDVCAGFGGKSTHMIELMGGRGEIFALDLNYRRLVSLCHNSQRLGIPNIRPMAADASKSLLSLFRRKFDKVMVDAPCSGLGVLSRHPDGKWNRDEKDIKRLALLQKGIMNEAASVTQNGGMMLYATCSISREENEDVVRDFLGSNREMSLENLKEHVPAWGLDLIDDQGFLKTFPHIHHMDGFFAALFRKNA